MRAIDAGIKTKFTTKVGDAYPAIYTDVGGRLRNTWVTSGYSISIYCISGHFWYPRC